MIGGFGGAALDSIFYISNWPQPNQTSYIQYDLKSPGGMTLGALLAAARLGVPATFLGALGNDEEGTQLTNFMNSSGIECRNHLVIDSGKTPVSQIMIDPEARRTIFHNRGIRQYDSLGAIGSPCLEGIDLLLLDGSWIEDSLRWAEEASGKGIPIVLDLSPNNLHPLRDRLIQLADYPVLSEVLAGKITGKDEPEDQIFELCRLFKGEMIITAGARGVWWGSRDGEQIHLPAYQVDVVDTTGAGDTFHGAFAAAIHDHMALKDAISFAMGASALKCTGRGQDCLPDRQTLHDFLFSEHG